MTELDGPSCDSAPTGPVSGVNPLVYSGLPPGCRRLKSGTPIALDARATQDCRRRPSMRLKKLPRAKKTRRSSRFTLAVLAKRFAHVKNAQGFTWEAGAIAIGAVAI